MMQGTLFISMLSLCLHLLSDISVFHPHLLSDISLTISVSLSLTPSISIFSASPPNWKQGNALNSSVRITYWHGNRLIICLFMSETEIRKRKDDGKLKDKQTSIASVPDYCPTTAIFPTPLIFHCTQSFSQSFWRFNATYINTFVQHIWLATTKPYCIFLYSICKY